MSLPKKYDPDDIETKWQKKWRELKLFKFDPDSDKPIFSIDTPPPYISGDLHAGHGMGYGQAEFIARYKRMKGFEVFYPMGFDDNGLPTERYVERKYDINSNEMKRSEFIDLCIDETKESNKVYKEIWNSLGISVDWGLFYSTIDDRSREVSQRGFLDLFDKGRVYRDSDPILWCPECQTALAQADLEGNEENTNLNTIVFESTEFDDDIHIATTRPELLPACVAVLVDPEDDRWNEYIGSEVKVPLFDRKVKVIGDKEVDSEFGTGAVMVCTFGDKTDIKWWREYDLDLELVLDENGILNEKAGKYEGLDLESAREEMLDDLESKGHLIDREQIRHNVNVHERCDTPAEFLLKKQWFVEILDIKEDLIEQGRRVDWHPEHMRKRYEDWVNGLKWDWCISRQRHYGVPMPLWYCDDCGEVMLPDEDELPVDPIEERPDKKCSCGSDQFTAETDVFDTWFTSSMTPQINGRWGSDNSIFDDIYPMNFRPQGYDIIRTWAFYTIVRSYLHHDSIPWRDIFINGMGLDENGEKMSKSRGNVVKPEKVIDEYSADAFRWWSSGVKLGEDLPFKMKDVVSGHNFMKKLWNASRFVSMHLDDYDDTVDYELETVDRWILHKYNEIVKETTELFEDYKYSKSKRIAEQFFWNYFCDNYLEMVKHRLYNEEEVGTKSKQAALYTLRKVLMNSLKLFAPIIPHITEEIYQELFVDSDEVESIHLSQWPEYDENLKNDQDYELGELAKDLVVEIRRWKSDNGIPLNEELEFVQISTDSQTKDKIEKVKDIVKGTINLNKISYQRVRDSGSGVKVEDRPIRIIKFSRE